MRTGRVRKGLNLMTAAVVLLLLGTFYSQQINALFSLPADGSLEFVRLSFLWGTVLGCWGVAMLVAGLLQRPAMHDQARLMLPLLILFAVLVLFFTLFYRTLALPPSPQPLRPGETIVI